jgi:hypothetical protein
MQLQNDGDWDGDFFLIAELDSISRRLELSMGVVQRLHLEKDHLEHLS